MCECHIDCSANGSASTRSVADQQISWTLFYWCSRVKGELCDFCTSRDTEWSYQTEQPFCLSKIYKTHDYKVKIFVESKTLALWGIIIYLFLYFFSFYSVHTYSTLTVPESVSPISSTAQFLLITSHTHTHTHTHKCFVVKCAYITYVCSKMCIYNICLK